MSGGKFRVINSNDVGMYWEYGKNNALELHLYLENHLNNLPDNAAPAHYSTKLKLLLDTIHEDASNYELLLSILCYGLQTIEEF